VLVGHRFSTVLNDFQHLFQVLKATLATESKIFAGAKIMVFRLIPPPWLDLAGASRARLHFRARENQVDLPSGRAGQGNHQDEKPEDLSDGATSRTWSSKAV